MGATDSNYHEALEQIASRQEAVSVTSLARLWQLTQSRPSVTGLYQLDTAGASAGVVLSVFPTAIPIRWVSQTLPSNQLLIDMPHTPPAVENFQRNNDIFDLFLGAQNRVPGTEPVAEIDLKTQINSLALDKRKQLVQDVGLEEFLSAAIDYVSDNKTELQNKQHVLDYLTGKANYLPPDFSNNRKPIDSSAKDMLHWVLKSQKEEISKLSTKADIVEKIKEIDDCLYDARLKAWENNSGNEFGTAADKAARLRATRSIRDLIKTRANGSSSHTLDLSKPGMKSIPPLPKDFVENLTYLALSSTHIESVGELPRTMPNLKTLVLRNSKVNSLEHLPYCPNLKTLILEGSNITALPDWLGSRTPMLHHLDISRMASLKLGERLPELPNLAEVKTNGTSAANNLEADSFKAKNPRQNEQKRSDFEFFGNRSPNINRVNTEENRGYKAIDKSERRIEIVFPRPSMDESIDYVEKQFEVGNENYPKIDRFHTGTGAFQRVDRSAKQVVDFLEEDLNTMKFMEKKVYPTTFNAHNLLWNDASKHMKNGKNSKNEFELTNERQLTLAKQLGSESTAKFEEMEGAARKQLRREMLIHSYEYPGSTMAASAERKSFEIEKLVTNPDWVAYVWHNGAEKGYRDAVENGGLKGEELIKTLIADHRELLEELTMEVIKAASPEDLQDPQHPQNPHRHVPPG